MIDVQAPPRIWYYDLSPDQRKAFWAAYLGWTLDGFDFYILSLLLVEVQRSFTVSSALAGALATVTLMFRVFGGISAGLAADKWGRKLPLMLGILWYSSFAFLSAFSTSYGMLFARPVTAGSCPGCCRGGTRWASFWRLPSTSSATRSSAISLKGGGC